MGIKPKRTKQITHLCLVLFLQGCSLPGILHGGQRDGPTRQPNSAASDFSSSADLLLVISPSDATTPATDPRPSAADGSSARLDAGVLPADQDPGPVDPQPPVFDSAGSSLDASPPPPPPPAVQSFWNVDVSTATLHPRSDAIISWLANAGGWGGGTMRIDFSINVLADNGSTPMRSFIPTEDFFLPDCDQVPMPVPANGALEGETSYECASDGDCHLLVLHTPTNTVYEMWRANIVGNTFYGGCLAVWDLSQVYGPHGRGMNCTSADAAGLPITPLLFSADEVSAGAINHAIRFILPNSRIRHAVFTWPATHSTNATSGGTDAPPYGVHLRLKSSVDINALPPGAQVVATALKKYGMFLADGGNIALTAQSDRFTAAKWAGLLETSDLSALLVADFEVVDQGPDITYTGDCVREP